MQLDLFTLARYAEAQGDLLNIIGAGWDTMHVTEAPQSDLNAENTAGNLPPAVVGGALVARLRCHAITETNREHTFSVTLVDEDGGEVSRLGGNFNVQRAAGVPVGWPQNMNVILPLGIPLPRFGTYTFSFEVDGQHLGDLAFRVVAARMDGAEQQAA
jgi:hypothetical protein